MSVLYQYGIVLIAIISAAPVHAQQTDSAITLKQALVLALEKSPELAMFSAELRAGEARILQAGLRPNPELKIAMEDFAGSGNFGGTRQLQATLLLSQELELGKKRGARRNFAMLSSDLTMKEHDQRRVEVIADVTTKFYSLVAAQNFLEVSMQFTMEAETSLQRIRERLAAGKGSVLEEMKATITQSRSRIDEANARLQVEAELQNLAAAVGSVSPAFNRAEADLFALRAVPDLNLLINKIQASPEMVRLATEKQMRKAAIRMERSKGLPNLSVGGGLRRVQGTGDQALVAEFSLPLPFLDRNQGGRHEAITQLERVEISQLLSETKFRMELYTLHQRLTQAASEFEIIRNELLPQAENALTIAEGGFHQGRFTYLELSDTQNTLLEIKKRHIEAASLYQTLVAEIDRLTGNTIQQ